MCVIWSLNILPSLRCYTGSYLNVTNLDIQGHKVMLRILHGFFLEVVRVCRGGGAAPVVH
jgi:hypothetical protein